MTQTFEKESLGLDYVRPGMLSSPLATDMSCDYHWLTNLPSGRMYDVVCTRSNHLGRQHVAEGETHVIAVHPWE